MLLSSDSEKARKIDCVRASHAASNRRK